MSESMAGVTFLAFGNGSPDVFSTFAAFNTNSASLAIGELIGAACFISAVVAGSMALVRPFKVARRSFVRDVCFFIVAASFSMGFIWDGKLSLWESITMVGFYIFYVCFVMVWHWWLGRRKARRLRTAATRSHYVVPGGEEEEIPQEYHDEDDGPASESRPAFIRGVSADDFAALEQAGSEERIEADDNEEMRERWLGELNNNMRVSRPSLGARRSTHTPIRPSLVGALEFRAVLSSLQKSRNIQSMPISLRRYSDDLTYTTTQQRGVISTISDLAPRPPYEVEARAFGQNSVLPRPAADIQRNMASRIRAVSTNDMENTRLDPGAWRQQGVPTIDFGPASPEETRTGWLFAEQNLISPNYSLSPPGSEQPSRSTSPVPPLIRHPSSDRLAPPDVEGPGNPVRQRSSTPSPLSSPSIDPEVHSTIRPQPKLIVPGASSPPVPFPPYTDNPTSAHSSRPPSIRLPPPSASPASYFNEDQLLVTGDRAKVPRWWPSRFLPLPGILLATLFPTLANWRDKNIWEKMLGVVASPSVFLLTVTLPVVETQREESDEDATSPSRSFSLPGPLAPVNGRINAHQRSMVPISETDGSSNMGASRTRSATSFSNSKSNGAARNAVTASGSGLSIATSAAEDEFMQSLEQPLLDSSTSEHKSWNRWLVIIQCFTAPFFVVFIFWANTAAEYPRALLKPTLYSLLFSLGMLALLLSTTMPTQAPRWRTLLCFMGFAVSIAWISSIANEVVGVLKTLGVILDMSDAILGLTIFAVGNSLGDLVADITVARLGFPVMALSACFGGPMLNTLLGIGISGCYMTIKGSKSQHRKHPDRPVRFKPYHIDISTTLVISGASLLVTLVGLLLAVPWRRWKMDRAIGWSLVALWCASTLANVVVEVVGLGRDVR